MKKIGLFIIVIMLFSSTGCDIVEGSNPEGLPEMENDQISVTLYNSGVDEVHMWITNQEINPYNKITAGESRKTTYWFSQDLRLDKIKKETMTVYAGRNGVTLDTKSYTVNKSDTEIKTTWTGTKLR